MDDTSFKNYICYGIPANFKAKGIQVGTISRSKGALKSNGVRRSKGKSASSKVRRPSMEAGTFFEIYIF